jgi:predicted transposase/invertase (TIGR01784 family)
LEREKAKEEKAKAVKKAEEKGLMKGKYQKAVAIAKAGLKKGLAIEMISELTGLTREEVEKIK